MSPEEFMKRVSVSDSGCWEWLLRVDNRGYGRWCRSAAHRVSYELFVGPIPDDLTVDHICWNTICVNPDHLQLLTLLDNTRRQRSAFATHCKNGHEFTPENTYRRTEACDGQRQCRTCNRDAQRRYKQRKRTA